MIRKAVHRPDRPIVLAGIWLLFGPSAVALGMKLLAILGSDGYGEPPLESIVTIVVVVLLHGGALALLGTILFSTTRNFLRRRAKAISQE